jgi:hypothetical protein
VRLIVDHAECAQGAARDRERDSGVGDDLEVPNSRIVAIGRILACVGDDQRFLERDGVLAE